MSSAQSSLARTWFFRVLGACIVVGIAIRIVAICYLDRWHDELYSLDVANKSFDEFCSFVRSGEDYHPPLFYFILQLARLLAPEPPGDFFFSCVNLLWFPVTLLGLALYTNPMPQARKAILVAAVIITFSPVFLYMGAELRMYSELCALATLSTVCAVQAHASLQSRWFVLFGLCSGLGAMTHYSSFLVTAALGISMVLLRRPDAKLVRGCLLAALIFVLVILPMAGVLSRHLVKEPAYAVPLWRSAFYVGMSASLPLLIASLLAARFAPRRHDADAQRGDGQVLKRFVSLAAVVFVSLALVLRLVLGINLVNLGVSLVPALWIIIAFAIWLANQRPRFLVGGLSGVLMAQAGLCVYLVHDPSILSGNRLPTVTKYRRFVDGHPNWADLQRPGQAVVLIDWPRDNDYFGERATSLLGSSQLFLVSRSDQGTVPKLVRRYLRGEGEEVLLVARGRITSSMTRGLAPEFILRPVARGLALVTAKN